MTGGRGISTVIGVMVAFLMWPEILIGIVVVGIIGTLWLKDMALWMFVMILALPVMAYLFDFFDLFERDMTIVILFGCSSNRAAGEAIDRQLGATGAGLQLASLPVPHPLGP